MTLLLHEVAGSAADSPLLLVHQAASAWQAGGAPPAASALAGVRLRPAIGQVVPRFWFHVGCTVHAAPTLGLFHRQRTLQLGNDHTGASELVLQDGSAGTAVERAAALQLALQGALLLLAQRRALFAARLVAEMPGVHGAHGPATSPFWQGLVRHFHAGEPADAMRLLGEHWRAGVAALLPRHLIYTAFLPAAAQAAIAQVPASALAQREALEEAGLRYAHHVCIDDAGPVLEAETDLLPAVADSRTCTLADDVPGTPAPHWLLVDGAGQARVARVQATVAGGRAQVAAASLRLLGTAPGQQVRVLALR